MRKFEDMTPRECREILQVELHKHHYTMEEFDNAMEELENPLKKMFDGFVTQDHISFNHAYLVD